MSGIARIQSKREDLRRPQQQTQAHQLRQVMKKISLWTK